MYLPPACYFCLAPPGSYEETIRNPYVRGGPPQQADFTGAQKMEHRRGEVYVTVHVLMCLYMFIFIYFLYFFEMCILICLYSYMQTWRHRTCRWLQNYVKPMVADDMFCSVGFKRFLFFGNSRKLLETLKEFDLLIPPISDARARLPKCKMQGLG